MKRIFLAVVVAFAVLLGGTLVVRADELFTVSASPIPDWTKWECNEVHVTHVIIETLVCRGPDGKEGSRILLRLKGSKEPFLIGWGLNKGAANPRQKVHAAIFKGGRWIIGAPGTGFTTEESAHAITFYIFLDEQFSSPEQLEIKIPEPKADKAIG